MPSPRFSIPGLACLLAFLSVASHADPSLPASQGTASLGPYVVLAWNDLGMHCMNDEFSTLCILPPFNTIQAHVIRRGNPPELVTGGVVLHYRFPENTYSAGKVNFWDYENALFGVDLPTDVGLGGKGLTGEMDWNGSAWEALGIPITPFTDAAPTVEQPYQLAEITVRDASTDEILDQTTIVAPVSVEIHCDTCHRRTGRTSYEAILIKHDDEEGTDLMNERPVLCARCHASNALGTTGTPGVPSLSEAIHEQHKEEVTNDDCYACHPGNQTQCNRGVMFQEGKYCTDCHGNMDQMAESIKDGRRPWFDEPKCASCHPAHPENPNTLYRMSRGHGGLFCEACHNSTHAELPTVQPRDGLQAMRVQGEAVYIKKCMVCHTQAPLGPGPHGLTFKSSPLIRFY